MLILKYKPETLEDTVLPEKYKNLFQKELNNNYLFYSGPGTGKTCTAVAIGKHHGYDVLYANASIESSVDYLKEKVIPFCSSSSLISNKTKKLVILDEFDGVSLQYKKALRGIINDYSNTTNFILTCNSPRQDDFFTALKSRFIEIDFSFPNNGDSKSYKIGLILRIVKICEKENIKITKKVAWELIDKTFPDFRKALQNLDFLISTKNLKEIKSEHINYENFKREDNLELIDLILKGGVDSVEIHKIIYGGGYLNKVEESFVYLHQAFFDYIFQNKPELSKYVKSAAICIAKWDANKDKLVSPIHALKACIYELQNIFNLN